MQSNFLVQNDPMLVALLAVGPWTILLVSILVQVAVPGMFAYFGQVYQQRRQHQRNHPGQYECSGKQQQQYNAGGVGLGHHFNHVTDFIP
jgi:hypothetical protein